MHRHRNPKLVLRKLGIALLQIIGVFVLFHGLGTVIFGLQITRPEEVLSFRLYTGFFSERTLFASIMMVLVCLFVLSIRLVAYAIKAKNGIF